jgi:hypothetical protein
VTGERKTSCERLNSTPVSRPALRIRDPQGLRLGDRFALTQVVEGFGAKDLIRELLQSLVEVMGQLDERLHRPGKVPIKSPRLQGERPATTVQDIKNRDAASSVEETLVGRR